MQFQIILNIQAIKHEAYATFSIIRRTADMPKKWLIKVPESQNTASPRGPGPRKREEGEAPRDLPLLSNARRWSAASCSPTGLPRSTIGARGLNFRVRNGTGCASPAMAADQRRAFDPRDGRAVPWGPHSAPRRLPHHEVRTDPAHVGKRRARPISTARLSASRRLQLRPINLVVYEGPYRKENSSRDWLPA